MSLKPCNRYRARAINFIRESFRRNSNLLNGRSSRSSAGCRRAGRPLEGWPCSLRSSRSRPPPSRSPLPPHSSPAGRVPPCSTPPVRTQSSSETCTAWKNTHDKPTTYLRGRTEFSNSEAVIGDVGDEILELVISRHEIRFAVHLQRSQRLTYFR